MSLIFTKNGNLDKGIHDLTIEEFDKLFGYNQTRIDLIAGLKKGIEQLKDCGCKTIYIDGSFVSKKETPGDFDACWDTAGVDIYKLVRKYPILLDWENGRKNQKNEYLGEFFMAENVASYDPYATYIDFFQKDKDGNTKGIVKLKLD